MGGGDYEEQNDEEANLGCLKKRMSEESGDGRVERK